MDTTIAPANGNKQVAYQRSWRIANREQQKAYKREWYKKNKERLRARRRELYAENRDSIIAKVNTHREKFPEKMLVRSRKYRASKPRWWWILRTAKARASKANLPFDLDDAWANERWTGRCELTGIEFSAVNPGTPGIYSPSVDRIVPGLGYVKDNCRFILHALNSFKQNGTDAQMLELAKALLVNTEQRSSH